LNTAVSHERTESRVERKLDAYTVLLPHPLAPTKAT
jgi:hypothetical protein